MVLTHIREPSWFVGALGRARCGDLVFTRTLCREPCPRPLYDARAVIAATKLQSSIQVTPSGITTGYCAIARRPIYIV